MNRPAATGTSSGAHHRATKRVRTWRNGPEAIMQPQPLGSSAEALIGSRDVWGANINPKPLCDLTHCGPSVEAPM
eukprot:7130383-Pyramimonas_sp.AAC.1